ncbi:hypothetical protein AOCH_006979, partial [Aspergillus ochraceoroseus]
LSLTINHRFLVPYLTHSSSIKQFARYKLFAGPFAKVFLGAVFTYQVIRWTWLKLEMDETKVHRNQEVIVLEKEARELTGLQQK